MKMITLVLKLSHTWGPSSGSGEVALLSTGLTTEELF